MTEIAKPRPKYLNLFEIKLPVAGFASILHRVSGAALFLLLPWLIFLFDISLKSPESFARFQSYVAHPFVKLVLLGLVWAFLHHFCMGIRVLLIDIQVGVEKAQAAASAKAVLAISLGLTLIVAIKFLGVF